jgi:hypothetical protein
MDDHSAAYDHSHTSRMCRLHCRTSSVLDKDLFVQFRSTDEFLCGIDMELRQLGRFGTVLIDLWNEIGKDIF